MSKRPEESIENMIAGLEDKTGKTLHDWSQIIRSKALQKHGEIIALLKSEYGVSHGYANQIALRYLKLSKPGPEQGDAVDAMFAGSRAACRPTYDLVLRKIKEFGSDVDLAPKKGYASVRRKKQFAILQPASGRLDIGINLKGVPADGRLEASGSFNAMLSHRVRVAKMDEVDEQLITWLKAAYGQA